MREHGVIPIKDIDEMENVQLTNDIYNKIKFLEFTAFYFAWIGNGTAVVEYEVRYDLTFSEKLTDSQDLHLFILLMINAFCTICCSVSIVARYIFILKWQIEKKIVLPLDTLITTKYYKKMLMEMFAVFLSPWPFLNHITFTESYPDRDLESPLRFNVVLLTMSMIIRLYLMIRFLLSSSKYRDSR